MKRWMLRSNKVDTEKMAESLGISPIMAQIIANRGIGTYESAKNFIDADLQGMYDGALFKDIKKGIDILNHAIDNKVKISVYGDYDVDGVTSSVILYKTIKTFTTEIMYYVPHRQKEGYGINMASIDELYNEGVKLIVCCDNGIAAINESERIKELGMELVIIDHHEPAFEEKEDGTRTDIIPVADAVIDSKQKDCEYPFKSLCAAGMCYKFSKLLFESRNEKFHLDKELLVFAGIGTICDIVDLLDENRIIAKNGLKLIPESPNVGLRALINETGISDINDITEYHVGFVLGPCINATGRLESAKTAIELFTTDDEDLAKELAKELSTLNAERKEMTKIAADECLKSVEEENLLNDKVLVIYNENIHESIAGIVAGRVKDAYYKPTIVITQGDEMAKGSARSIEGYNVFEELLRLNHLFHKFGGHPMAAGLSLLKENIDSLRKSINENCVLTEKEMTQTIRIERSLELGEINMPLAKELKIAAPFGKENPTPIFGSKDILAEKVSLIGKDKRILKFSLRDTKKGTRFDAIDFKGYEVFCQECIKKHGEEKAKRILAGRESVKMDIVYTIGINTYLGHSKVQLLIKDFRI